jgi:glycosyltransferase involved in cell wall biosynthesis
MQKILILIDWFYPAFKAGGPVQSCLHLVNYFEDAIKFKILTSNHDLNPAEKLDVPAYNQWQSFNNTTKVYYANSSSRVRRQIKKQKSDLVYINGIFSLHYNIIPLLLYKFSKDSPKMVVAPRGMLQKGALAIKPFKKRLFLFLFKFIGLHKQVHWHATDQQEVEDIRCTFGRKTRITLAPNIPDSGKYLRMNGEKKSGELKLATISLITIKKNLHQLIQILSKLNLNITYHIYGPIKDQEYWQKCQKLIKEAPSNISIEYKGPINPFAFHETISEYHFFILPTLGENFGHAIYQALNSWRPVIISDRTPWRNLSHLASEASAKETKNAGWDLPLHQPQRWQDILRKCYQMEQHEYDQLCNGAHALAREYIEKSNFKEQYRELFEI